MSRESRVESRKLTADEQQSAFPAEELLRRGIAFGGKALPVLAWPFSPDRATLSSIAEGVSAVARAAEIVCDAFARDERLRAFYGYGALQESCILKDPGYRPLIPLGRLDSFLAGGEPRFMEYNTDGTAGWHYASALTGIWRDREGLPPEARPLPDRLLDTLLRCFRQWDRRGVQRPSIAIVDWRDVGTRPEQEALAARFSARGYPCRVADPRELRLEGGRLAGDAGPVDLVYRRLVSEEAFERAEEIRPFLDAFLSGAACFVGAFRTDPAWSKLLFAVLSDPAWEQLFPADLAAALPRWVPWTRRVRPGEVFFEGERAEMAELLIARKGRFLLKPERAFEGRGVMAGASCPAARWAEAVHGALASGGWIAQEYVRAQASDVPGHGRAFLQVGEFVLEGKLAGFLPRVSPTRVITPRVRERYCPVGVEG
jgi:hypothetical protein